VRAGKDIFIAQARDFMTTRMYGSLREIVAGWSKNLASGAPLMAPPIAVVRAVVPYVLWLPALFWLAPPILWLANGRQWAAVATVVSLLHLDRGVRPRTSAGLVCAPLSARLSRRRPHYDALGWRGRRLIEWRGRSYRPRNTASPRGTRSAPSRRATRSETCSRRRSVIPFS